jgi:hypothetical protein
VQARLREELLCSELNSNWFEEFECKDANHFVFWRELRHCRVAVETIGSF